MKVTQEMVDRFLNWRLPQSVCSDLCVTMGPAYPHPRCGTSLLNMNEAREMLEYVLAADASTPAATVENGVAGSVAGTDDAAGAHAECGDATRSENGR